ncbi:hypothetical protein OSB04_014714 [Centaurea solstitialis]|uniref:Nuclease HARBI1 n=1 Tax=Centaurea solstitialis TaxID=347529 RepID=A0AA38WI04_9ASTR|nr:hypothetical protein OSB04_014714 [Centaurea solstitialis]
MDPNYYTNLLNSSTSDTSSPNTTTRQVQPLPFVVNGTEYNKGYYLGDGIYPEWAMIVKSFPHPSDPKRKKFKEMQEAARKDVERAFGVLQSRWAIIRGPARVWQIKIMSDIIYACIILHNMIIENEGISATNWSDDHGNPPIPVSQGSIQQFQQYLQMNAEIRDRSVHHQLRADFVEHIWERFGEV